MSPHFQRRAQPQVLAFEHALDARLAHERALAAHGHDRLRVARLACRAADAARRDGLVPWKELEKAIRPHYPKAGRGRRPYPLSAMLRVHCVQLFHNLSDPAMEDMLYEVESVRRFAGLKLSALPDETTILNFRHLLERHGLGEKLLSAINASLASRGLRLREGTVVDASLVEAPSSTKNRSGSTHSSISSGCSGTTRCAIGGFTRTRSGSRCCWASPTC